MLLPFLLCLLVSYTPPAGGTAGPAWLAAVGVLLAAAANAAVGWGVAAAVVRLRGRASPWSERASACLLALLKGALVGFTLADVFVFRWPLAVEQWTAGHRWAVLVDDTLLVLPAVAMTLTAMAFWHRVEARRGLVALPLWRHLWLRFRIEMGIVLAPWLTVVLATDLTAAAFWRSPHAEAAEAASFGAALLLVIVFSPYLLRVLWTSAPLPPGPLRQRLEEFCRAHKFRCHDILVWHTHNHLANAGVVGPTRLLRYVMLTDVLVEHCTPDELEAVLAHEVAHVRLHHLGFYAFFGVAFMCFCANLIDVLAGLGWVEPLDNVLELGMTGGQGLALLIFAGLYWAVAFGAVSRRLEQQADLYAIAAAREPQAFLTALAKLAMLGNVPPAASSWRHFSIARRIQFLSHALSDPSVGARFRKKIWTMQAGLVALFAAGVARLLLVRPELFGL